MWTAGGCGRKGVVWLFTFVFVVVKECWKRMWASSRLCDAARKGDVEMVSKILDKEEAWIISAKEDRVSVCVLCLLILLLFGIA